MDFITWTSTGLKLYLGDDIVISLTYDELTLYLIVLGICVGLIIGLIASYKTRITAHRAIRSLTAAGCNSPETAVTVDSLPTPGRSQIKRMLKSGKMLRRTVLCANEDEMPQKTPSKAKKFFFKHILSRDIPQKTDFSIARFYIPEENQAAAEARYSCEGMSPVALLITIVVLVAVAIGALFIIPELMQMADNVFGSKAE